MVGLRRSVRNITQWLSGSCWKCSRVTEDHPWTRVRMYEGTVMLYTYHRKHCRKSWTEEGKSQQKLNVGIIRNSNVSQLHLWMSRGQWRNAAKYASTNGLLESMTSNFGVKLSCTFKMEADPYPKPPEFRPHTHFLFIRGKVKVKLSLGLEQKYSLAHS
jgi:hypothetical protein